MVAPLQYFAPPTVAAFNFVSKTHIDLSGTTGNVALTNNATTGVKAIIARVTNTGSASSNFAYIKLGVGNGTTVSVNDGLAIAPGASIYLAIGSATYLAGIAGAGTPTLSIEMGF